MKILHVIFSFTPDGAETMLVDIINEQSKTDEVELIIINNLYNRELIKTINNKATVFCLDRKVGSINPFKLIKLNSKIFKYRPNVIHFHSYNAIGLLINKRRVVTFLTIHGLNRPLKYFSKYDKLIAISETVQKDLLKRGGFDSTIIYNGIDFSKIKIKKESNCSNEIFRIVAVGRLFHEIKGQHVLLKALYNLVHIKGYSSIKLDFIGEGPSLNYLIEMTDELKLSSHVNFLGLKNRTFIYDNLAEYNLLVQPSIHEGFGLTVVEGMAAKIPVLVSDIYGPLEIIKNGEYGSFFKTEDSEDCAKQIENIFLEKNDSKRNSKLYRAYNYALTSFSVKNTARKYLNEYYKTAKN